MACQIFFDKQNPTHMKSLNPLLVTNVLAKKLNEGICQSEQHSNEFSMNIYFIEIEEKKLYSNEIITIPVR